MSERQERQWILAIQKGDKKYLQDIAEKYYDDIFRFCAFQTGSIQDAYDLAQETFLRFIRYVESYQYRNLKGYLLTIAMNVCRNYHRRNHTDRRENVSWGERVQGMAGEAGPAEHMSLGHGGSGGRMLAYEDGMTAEDCIRGGGRTPEEVAVEREGTALLMEALGNLPDGQREVILLHYFYDMKYWEIGRLSGVGLATVKSRARQGVEKLRGMLRKEDFYSS